MHKARNLSYYTERAEKTRGRRNPAYRTDETKCEADRLIKFASRAGANSETLKRLSFVADFSGKNDLLKLRNQIVEGEMEELFPTEKIVGRERDSAAEISDYLGVKRVDLCIKKALGNENVEETARAERYLRWAAQNGAPGVRERALAGLATILGEKLKKEGNLVARGSMLARNESANVLKKELGNGTAESLLNEHRKGGKIVPWAVISLSGCLGVGVGSAAGFLHELMEGRFEFKFAIVYGIASLVALVALEISKARALPYLAERIGGMLKEREGKAGQL